MTDETKKSSQNTDNKEHDDFLEAKRITDVGTDNQTVIFAKSANITYIGVGARGLATSADGWLVTKIDESADPTLIQHAVGILDNKSSLTYS